MNIQHKNTYGLLICVIVLAVLCVLSVSSPMRFGHQQQQREKAVKERLIKIRTAEEKYRLRHGVYTADFSTLIKSGLLADSLQYIPYSDGKRFTINVTTIIAKSGRQIPLMECSAAYDDYLKRLDKNSVDNLTQAANESGRFPGLKFGDTTQPNDNAGNWE